MKVAVVHDWIVNIGGAEKVLKAILEVFPDADVYTLVYLKNTVKKLGIEGKVYSSFINGLPLAKEKYSYYLPLMPLAVEQFDLSKYDLVISSSHCVAKGVLTKSYQTHVCYCHTPMRYIWDLYFSYLKDQKLEKGIKNIFVRLVFHYLRMWDVLSANRVDYFIANSQNVADRIKKIYRRDSVVIYPPVDVELFSPSDKKEDYFIVLSRLVPYKKVDLVVEVFNDLKLPLLVIGDGEDMQKIKKMARENIKILGWQEDSVVREYLSKAQALIFASEEDFGIVPVEAQASGTPVIAYKRGGAKETVIEGETGIFFEEQNVESLKEAVLRFLREKDSFKKEKLIENAKRFSKERFKSEFKSYIEGIIK
ncbi:MAG: glycosyltransferase family 4 protein [Dictyoglomus thermophilum]|uniref:Glycosyltransferase family 4 protein n=1 Tax=Dictyoglomus thermophilum TaxID=14 RepID=A0A7V3ZJN9_DICTH|nr:glycosyltransferase family 4 protein [Dictyoglomus thermophilum]MCX7721228.1 glycosyltransferase family 4 protein [Dictyoglomus thermophilum]TYT22831.1 glycosyltransferase family 4 protein [Dictyoglomus thermophilum]